MICVNSYRRLPFAPPFCLWLGCALPPSALVGEVLSEEEEEGVEKSGESSVPILDPSPSTMAAFAFAEPTGAATDSDDEQVRFNSIQIFSIISINFASV